MRARFLFGSLTLAVCVFSPSLFGNKEKAIAGLSVRQKVQSEVDNLKKNMRAAKTRDEKLRFLLKSEQQIQDLRKREALQPDPDEIYMDLLLASLKRIPRGSDFKTGECENYETNIRSRFDPKGEEKLEPAIQETMQVLEVLCK